MIDIKIHWLICIFSLFLLNNTWHSKTLNFIIDLLNMEAIMLRKKIYKYIHKLKEKVFFEWKPMSHWIVNLTFPYQKNKKDRIPRSFFLLLSLNPRLPHILTLTSTFLFFHVSTRTRTSTATTTGSGSGTKTHGNPPIWTLGLSVSVRSR